VDVDDDDLVAVGRQRVGDRSPDPARAAGDERAVSGRRSLR
jgi:hypothetical protein